MKTIYYTRCRHCQRSHRVVTKDVSVLAVEKLLYDANPCLTVVAPCECVEDVNGRTVHDIVVMPFEEVQE